MEDDSKVGRRAVLGGLAALGAGLGMYAVEQEAGAAEGTVKLSFAKPDGTALGKVVVPAAIARAMVSEGVQFKVEISGVVKKGPKASGYIKFDGVDGE